MDEDFPRTGNTLPPVPADPAWPDKARLRYLLTQYRMLRAEILNQSSLQQQILTVTVTALAALLTIAFETKVEDLEAAKAFFLELGLELEGETTVEGPSVDRLIGLQNVRATLALMRTPDGHGRIELDKFHTPEAIRTGPENALVNERGIHRIMFAVEDLDDVVARLLAHGADLVGEVVQYEDTNRLASVRGPEGIIVGLAEDL